MQVTLTIDQGNSCAKASLFGAETLPERNMRSDRLSLAEVDELASGDRITGAIYSSVSGLDTRLITDLCNIVEGPVMAFTHQTRVPLQIDYATPHTLGLDRIAAAVGAARLYPGRALLIADVGTALTLDLLDAQGTFRGGNISAGIKLRLRALHSFTGRLPRVEKSGDCPAFGYDTATAMRSGAIRGLAAEVLDAYRRAAAEAGVEALVLTGGDASIIEPLLAESGLNPQREPQLVAVGLNSILHYNHELSVGGSSPD